MTLGDLAALRLHRSDALILDFDGTIVELGPDPHVIRLEDGLAATLTALARHLDGAVAILSGRDLRDLAGRSPASVWRIGTHGLEAIGPNAPPPQPPAPPPAAVLAPLRRAEVAAPGVWVEIKGPVAALHYRSSPEAADLCLDAAREAAAADAGYVRQAGKMVVEVKPLGANKGAAVRAAAVRPAFSGRRVVMLGDDATDEDAIAAAQELGGIGVKVGDGDTAATLRAPSPAAVREWLRREAERLENDG